MFDLLVTLLERRFLALTRQLDESVIRKREWDPKLGTRLVRELAFASRL